MQAWQVRKHGEPAEALECVAVAPPEPPLGFLRVRVAACALGLPDVFMCRGSYALTPELPFTPGQELCGEVTAASEGSLAQVGDRVMAISAFFLRHGGFAEEALVLDDFAFRAPPGMDDAEAAAFLIPYHTAWVGLMRRARLERGETLLVLGGAGGTGSAAIQLARVRGARVIATARGAARAAFCRSLGADVVIDPSERPLAQAVREATNGGGADVVYDPVGGDAFREATRCIAHEGRLLIVGYASGEWGRPEAAHMATHNYSVLGVMPNGYDRAFREEAQAALEGHLVAGEIRVPVERRLAFEALKDGLSALAEGQPLGKWVLMGPSAG